MVVKLKPESYFKNKYGVSGEVLRSISLKYPMTRFRARYGAEMEYEEDSMEGLLSQGVSNLFTEHPDVVAERNGKVLLGEYLIDKCEMIESMYDRGPPVCDTELLSWMDAEISKNASLRTNVYFMTCRRKLIHLMQKNNL